MRDESFEQNFVWYEWTFVDPPTDADQDPEDGPRDRMHTVVTDKDEVWRRIA